MFDPFGDYESEGYLRNKLKEKDLRVIKRIEHDFFEANIEEALNFINKIHGNIIYKDFLKVHGILFSDIYPWAGKDRLEVIPGKAISKGDILFARPEDTKLAIDQGLRLAQDSKKMKSKLGEVMGLFAYGHPFLDGNGRTMLVIYSELCRRSGFSIAWNESNKNDYLNALTDEIEKPGKGILDDYLLAFKYKAINLKQLRAVLTNIEGLDGLDERNQLDGDFSNPNVANKYDEFSEKRDYRITYGKN